MWQDDEAHQLETRWRAFLRSREKSARPIQASPPFETKETFLVRAERHFNLLSVEAKLAGFTPAHSSRDLELHAEWFVRFRALRQNVAQLAAEAHVTTGSAYTEIDRLRKLVDVPPLPRVVPSK